MDRTEVETYSQAVNAWVIRTPGRQFPAVVVQGDSLYQLFALAQSVLERGRACQCADEELEGEMEELRDLLWGRLHQYETILRENDLPLPYNRVLWPK